jgi:peptide/nickel transport system permease protein
MNNTTQSLTVIALHKFKRIFGAFSVAFIVILVLVSIFAYVLAPDNSENANQMHLSIHSKPPGFNVTCYLFL